MKPDSIAKSIETGELQLTFWENFDHFFIVISSFAFAAFIPAMLLFFEIKDRIYQTKSVANYDVLWFCPAFILTGVTFYFIQKKRLGFTYARTTLPRVEIDEIILNIARKSNWQVTKKTPNAFVARTPFSGKSWGEMVTVLFDEDKVLVNSICDPNKHDSVVSYGKNGQNVRRIIKRIRAAEARKSRANELTKKKQQISAGDSDRTDDKLPG